MEERYREERCMEESEEEEDRKEEERGTGWTERQRGGRASKTIRLQIQRKCYNVVSW